MSSRPDETRFVTCCCQHCNGGIEFDAREFEEGETRTVECPHCHQGTSIFIAPEHESVSPFRLSDFIGQSRVKARLELAIAAAKSRGEPLGHVLLIGPPGSGRATLANIIGREMGVNLKSTSGPNIEKAGDLAGLLTNMEEGEVLFIDEIHRLRRNIEEYFYPALNNFKLDVILDLGPSARSVRLNLPRFTLIGSTTNKEEMSRNLFSCFQIVESMEHYTVEELTAFTRRFAMSCGVAIDTGAAEMVAQMTDGTPLDASNRLRHVLDYANFKRNGKITPEIAEAALKMLAPSGKVQEDARDSRDGIPSDIRREVWRRDQGKCVKCGSRKNLEYDHIIPVSKGGSNTARNIELLCESCNRAKSDLIV